MRLTPPIQFKGTRGLDNLSVGFEIKADAIGEDGSFEGYGSVFNVEDQGSDMILKGAFKQTLKEWKAKKKLPKMLLQHGGGWGGSAVDMVPIGQWTSMEEDDHGLKVAGRLIAMETERARLIHAALKAGELDGLSIGFRAKEYVLGTKPDEPWRTIKRLELYEVSVVLFGMNQDALITSVKGDDLPTEREIERLLMRDAGLSAAEAKTLIASGYKSLKGARDAAGDDEDPELIELLRSATAALR